MAQSVDGARAETYLRCRAEDVFSAEPFGGFGQRVRAAVAVGAVADEVARRLLNDYRRASAFRYGYAGPDDDEDSGRRPIRTVACLAVIDQPWGSMLLTHLTSTTHETLIGVFGWTDGSAAASPGPATVSPGMRPLHYQHQSPWPDHIVVTDDRGRAHSAHFSGGSSDDGFEGTFTLSPPLDAACRHITVLGTHIDLDGSTTSASIRIESTDDRTPAERAARYLDILSPSSDHHVIEHDGVDLAAQTFIDLGVLSSVPDGKPPAVPVPWHRRGRPSRRAADQALRLIVVGAVTEPVDGLTISVPVLRARGGRIDLPYSWTSTPFGGNHGHIDREPLALHATDDLGHRYELETVDWGGGGRSFEATGAFDRELDPDAALLTFTFRTMRHDVHVDVPLEWLQRP